MVLVNSPTAAQHGLQATPLRSRCSLRGAPEAHRWAAITSTMLNRPFLLTISFLLAIVASLTIQRLSFAASPTCPVRQIRAPNSVSFTKDITTPTALREAILKYLNQGGSYSGLQPLAQENTVGSVMPVDLNKDGVEEIVFSSSVFNEAWGLDSWISIYQCQDGRYVSTDFELEPDYIHKVTIVRIIDLMGTGYPQAIFQYEQITSACTQGVIIVGWNGHAFVDSGQLPYVYCPATIKVFDYNKDGQKEIYLRGRTEGNLESGIGRGVVEIYQWKDNSFQRLEKTYLPSPYRIHVLQDAQVALDRKDILQAIAHYEKAATRAYLKNEPSVYEKMNNQDYAEQYQTAFANFRLVTLWLSIDRPHKAQNIIERMRRRYPPSKPGYELLELAITFQENFAKDNNLVWACTEVTSQINESYPYIAGYGYIGNWGIANVEYVNEDICPFK